MQQYVRPVPMGSSPSETAKGELSANREGGGKPKAAERPKGGNESKLLQLLPFLSS